MHRTAVVIGGGVIGLSTAYHLARKGYGSVVVLEKDRVGSRSSTRAAGIITGLLWTDTGIRTRKRSLELFRQLSQDLPGYQFRNVGTINLIDREHWPHRQALLSIYDRLAAPYEVLDADASRRRWPVLDFPPQYTNLYDPMGGYSEPDEYVPALAARIAELGVEVREQQVVSDLILRNGRAADGARGCGGRRRGVHRPRVDRSDPRASGYSLPDEVFFTPAIRHQAAG